MKKAYLAGPDVFRSNPIEFFDALKGKLALIDIQGLSPFDNECNNSQEIFLSNITLIHEADFVLANITPFRGPSVDPGTAFEIGYATALGKPIICYSEDVREYKDRAVGSEEFPTVEGFGLHENLMIAHSGPVYKTIDQALASLKRD
jgi:nucleoside 2-deoxyribosyltransferase